SLDLELHELRFATLCDCARVACPDFPKAELVHWRFDDPFVAMEDTKRKSLFQSLRDQKAHRIRLFALVTGSIRPCRKIRSTTISSFRVRTFIRFDLKV